MAGEDLNALGVILAAVIPAAALLRLGQRPHRAWWKLLLQSLGLVVLFAILWTLTLHGCGAGDPLLQWVVPCAAAVALSIFARPRWLRVGGPSALLLVSVALCWQFAGLVHQRDLTGNERWDQVTLGVERSSYEEVIRLELSRSIEDGEDHSAPAGWLLDSDLAELLPEELRRGEETIPGEVEVTPLWHTWLTGISRVSSHRGSLRLWYPGGPLSHGAERVELRRR